MSDSLVGPPVTAAEFEQAIRGISAKIEENAARIAKPRLFIRAETYWRAQFTCAMVGVREGRPRAREYRRAALNALRRATGRDPLPTRRP